MQRAVTLMGHSTLRQLGEEEDDGTRDDEDDDKPHTFAVGDVIGVVEEASRRDKPLVILGKVLRVDTRHREVLLAHLRPCTDDDDDEGGPAFQLVVGRNTWTESFEAVVHPIDVEYRRANNRYYLNTPAEEIHDCVKKGR